MARTPTLVERQSRRHRPILFLHVAMVDGDPKAAVACVHRGLRWYERSLSRFGVSRRDTRRLLRQLLVEPEPHHQPTSRQWPATARAALRYQSVDSATHNLRRFLARALRRRTAA